MASEGWEISIQVLEESIHPDQVQQTHEINVENVVEPLLSTEEFDLVAVKDELDTSHGEDKEWTNFSDLCRICAQESSDSIRIFSAEGLELRLPEIIPLCLPIEVSKEDALPQVICKMCLAAIQQSNLLRTTAKEADSSLRRILGQQVKNDELSSQEVLRTSSKKSVCELCRQHFLDVVVPHIITIGSIDTPTQPSSDDNLASAGNPKEEKTDDEECTDSISVVTTQSATSVQRKTKRKYNARRIEEAPPLKESKLRPRGSRFQLGKRASPKEKAPLPEITCPHCKSIFNRKDQFSKHLYLLHEIHLCPECDSSFEKHEDLANHTLEVHNSVVPPQRYHHPPGAPSVCSYCQKEFKSISGLCHHVDSLHLKIPGNFLCNQCGKPFYGKKKLELHMMRHTGIKTVMCQDCGKMFYNESTLKIHSEMHSVARKYKCSHQECDKTFKHWRNLYAHVHTVHGRKWNYACNACTLSFKTSEEALEHYLSHSEEEKAANGSGVPFTQVSPYECRICFKHYNSQLHYTNHMRSHENPSSMDADARNFECPTCQKRFKSKHYLKIHLGVHMSMKPFCCQYCGKSFITKMLLQTHERIHTNETPFRCEVCGKGFRAQKKLQIHKRDVHDKIKNFLCLTCGKAFSRKNHLDAHIRTHTNERPYQCDVCGQGFKQVGDMRRHVARHQNQSLYKAQQHYKAEYKPTVMQSVHEEGQHVISILPE